jgi:hypothetical protein
MKTWIILLSFISFSAFAENVSVKDVDTTQDTTIQIKKGAQNIDKQFEIVEGTEQISGDPAPLLKEARANWKTACADWKKESKELNKDNQVLTLSCGQMTCSTAAMESFCVSTGTHKIKTKVR